MTWLGNSFTFLATLLLLLSVSCAIVVRSLIIRRRYQRRVAEALAQGIMLPPTPHAQRRRDFGEKPKLWDAHAAPPEDVYGRWKDLMVGHGLLALSAMSCLGYALLKAFGTLTNYCTSPSPSSCSPYLPVSCMKSYLVPASGSSTSLRDQRSCKRLQRD